MSHYFMNRLMRGLEQYHKATGIKVVMDHTENGDGVIRFASIDAMVAPAWTNLSLYSTSSASNGKVTIRASYPRPPGIHHLSYPSLNNCTFSLETSLSDKAIANRVMREIIDPAREPMAQYLELIKRQKAEEDALPGVIAKYRAMGFNIHQPLRPNATEATFYHSVDAPKLSVSGRVCANGRVYFDRVYLDAERGEALMKFISEMR
jgi:hypothetical protein